MIQKHIKEFAQFDPDLMDDDDYTYSKKKKKPDVDAMVYYGTDSEDSDFALFP